VRADELEAVLTGRGSEVASVKSQLAAFKIAYRQQVGLLHEELDELEHAIAEAELDQRSPQATRPAFDLGRAPIGAETEPVSRYTSDAVRKLFRDVAKAIHPDLGGEETSRDWRHTLMVEANRAYELGDEERLRSILAAWERSPEAVQGSDPESTRLRLVRRIARMEEQIEDFAAELSALKESPVWKMKAMADEAAAKGKDLLRDMVARLKRDILVARNRLDAMQWKP